jgi:hypothetical protein
MSPKVFSLAENCPNRPHFFATQAAKRTHPLTHLLLTGASMKQPSPALMFPGFLCLFFLLGPYYSPVLLL